MLLHSDLKLRRWDPNVTVMNPHSVSPIRSYDDTLGGGRVLSMKPNYVMNTPMMTANNPYRALYYLPQTQSNDNSYCFTPEDIKDNINTAVKHYLLHERENMKQELVHEAMSDIRNEINHSYYIAEDQIDDEEEYGPRSERHRSTRKMMPKDSKLEKKNKTEKKKSKHRYHHHISEEEDEEEENRPLNHSSAVEDRSSKKPKRSSTAKSQDKKPRKDKKERRRGEWPRKSKSRDALKKKSDVSRGYNSKSSKRSYEFDFESDGEAKKTTKSKRTDKSHKKIFLQKTPKKANKPPKLEREFTFEKQQKDVQEEIITLKENMKDFESQIISMVRNLKIDADNREKLTDEKLKLARDPVGDYQTVREELEFFRNLIDALEEERKKDMLRSKQFVEEKAKDLYNDIELLRAREIKEVDKALDQTKYEVVEQLVESSDHQKRELREIRYEIDKNKEEIALMTNNIKNLRRRANEDMDRTEDRVIQKSDSNMLRTLSQQLEDQIDESMLKLRQDLRKDVELMIEDGISQNNENFVVPSIKSQTERNFDTFNMKKSHDEPKRVLVESPPPNERELRNKIDEILEPKCTQICRKIVDEELEVTKREIIDNEIEPICQKMMIEEYARSRRNIIDKEIEPKCREIIEEEAPAICEKEISKKLNTELKGAGVIRPVCKSIIEEEVSDIVNNAVKDEFTESRRMAIQNEIEPLWEQIIEHQVEDKYRDLVNSNLEHICREIVRDELETWAEREREEQFIESPMRNKVYKNHARSAQQLPIQITRIDESMEEESPEALPHHNKPPQSLIDGRSSAIKSESNFDSYSNDESHFKFSADPKIRMSKINKGERLIALRESKQDKLRDYLNDKFRPPSENRSETKRSDSQRSSRYSMNRGSSKMDKNKPAPMISFGASENKEDNSQAMFKYTESSPRDRDTYSFLDPESRARNILNSLEKSPLQDTELKNRISFGKTTEEEEYKVMSKSVFSYSEDLDDSNKFGMGGNSNNMKSQKYMDNVRKSQNHYMDVQDVIRENNKNREKL